MNIEAVIAELKRFHKDAKIALNYESNFQLLVAVILSAQCTDERVNMVTPALFARFPDAEAMAKADLEELEKLIYSTGFYKNKAKNIKGAAQRIVEEFDGDLPRTMEEMLTLPGAARKTANVVLREAFGVVVGIVVDTHVTRLSTRLGLISKKAAKSKNAVRIEKELMKVIPREDWGIIAHLLIHHGRKICPARKPKCEKCTISEYCPSAFKFD